MTGLLTLAPLLAAALALGAIVRWRGRDLVRAVLLWALLLAPPVAIAILLAVYGRPTFGTWLLFVPLTFAYLATIDWKCGVGARLARPPRVKERSRGASAGPSAER